MICSMSHLSHYGDEDSIDVGLATKLAAPSTAAALVAAALVKRTGHGHEMCSLLL